MEIRPSKSYGFLLLSSERTVSTVSSYLITSILRSSGKSIKDIGSLINKSEKTVQRLLSLNQNNQGSFKLTLDLIDLVLNSFNIDYLDFQKAVYKTLKSNLNVYYDFFNKVFKYVSNKKVRRLKFNNNFKQILKKKIHNRGQYSSKYFLNLLQKYPSQIIPKTTTQSKFGNVVYEEGFFKVVKEDSHFLIFFKSLFKTTMSTLESSKTFIKEKGKYYECRTTTN